jgi:hypothetical protein
MPQRPRPIGTGDALGAAGVGGQARLRRFLAIKPGQDLLNCQVERNHE